MDIRRTDESWLPETPAAPKLSLYFQVSAALLFLGIYVSIDFNFQKGGTVPMVSAMPGLFLILLYRGLASPRLARFALFPAGVVAAFGLVAPKLSTMFLNRAASVAQVAYAMIICYAVNWTLQRLGADRLYRILKWLIPIYLSLLVIEILSHPLQDLINAYNDAVFFAVDLDSLANRDAALGGYRPKFFTSEPSFVAITVMILITAYIWSGKGIARYFWAVFYTAVALVIIRSPIVVFALITIFVTMVTDKLLAKYRVALFIGVSIAATLAVIAALTFESDAIQNRISGVANNEDYSTIFRTYGAADVAINIVKKYPLFGAGPGGLDLVKYEIIDTEIKLGVPISAVEASWKISIANAPSSLLSSFGIIGFITGIWLLIIL
ncbi:MAG: hypothetical protein P4L95_05045, partial [Rouxiella aceris]|uniref:hypothetical protein n=1 Tax=Rouxiella aceris TaxID=2703884 RepID=UPI00284D05CB